MWTRLGTLRDYVNSLARFLPKAIKVFGGPHDSLQLLIMPDAPINFITGLNLLHEETVLDGHKCFQKYLKVPLIEAKRILPWQIDLNSQDLALRMPSEVLESSAFA